MIINLRKILFDGAILSLVASAFLIVTLKFIVIPGSKGAAGYKNTRYHFLGFLIGTGVSMAGELALEAIAWVC